MSQNGHGGPAPVLGPLSCPFYDAAAERRLVVQRCHQCGRRGHRPRPYCVDCGSSDFELDRLSGTATVFSASLVHRSFVPELSEATPYAVVIVCPDEDDRLRMVSIVRAPDADRIEVGSRVRVVFRHREEFGLVPEFELEKSA